jgi:ferredoxin-NADP reductase
MILNKPYVLSDIKKATRDVTTFTFKAQDGASIDFSPGMFAMLTYVDPVTKQKISRAFSIANCPPSGELQFFISMVKGQFTSKIENAKVGDVYLVSAPYGQFKLESDFGQKLLFIAGGTGLSPFFSMLKYIIGRGAKPDIVLLYSAKYPYDIIEQKALEEMVARLGAKLAITVTRPAEGDGWTGDTGRIDAGMISGYAPDVKERVSYICGPPEFVKALKNVLLGLGVAEKDIKAEMWG